MPVTKDYDMPPVPRTPRPSRADNTHSSLMLARRWSSPGVSLGRGLDLYCHYINGVNENEAMLRQHRKLLCHTADGKSRSKQLREAYLDNFTGAASVVTEWSRDKFKDWRRRHPLEDSSDDIVLDLETSLSGQGRHSAAGSTLTRKASRMSVVRSRESFIRMRSQSSMSLLSSGTPEEEKHKPRSVRTFWWYCRVIKAVCKLALDMQRLSMRRTEQTALSELYYVNVSGSKTVTGEGEENQIVFFDKSLFTRKRAACRVPEWAQNLMIRRADDRKPEDVQRLKHLLMSMRSFREKYTDDMRTKIAQVVRYTRCDKGRVVLRQGHVGHYFYFIYSGSIFIQIDLYDARTGQTTPSTENVIRTGESFGEIALLGDGTRSASVICREPTELCQIDKSTFLEICPALFQEQLQEKIHFAREFEIFSDWQEEQLKQLCFISQVLYFPHGRVVELDWRDAQHVFFVMRGRISMIKEFDAMEATDEEEEVVEDYDWKEEQRKEEEEERYNVLATVVSASKGAQLARAGSLVQNKRYACVGTLRAGQSTDLRILSMNMNQMKIPGITLLSEGVRVLRIAVRNFYRFAPIRKVEEYVKKHYIPMAIPSTKSIVKRYTKDLSWKTYRKRVMGTLERERTGQALVANLPATSKGTSGWARWPGFDPLAKEKSVVLSERGGRSEPDGFLQAMKVPLGLRARRHKPKKTGNPDFRRSVPFASDSGRKSMVPAVLKDLNDRSLMLYPPPKHNTAFLRRSFIKNNTQ